MKNGWDLEKWKAHLEDQGMSGDEWYFLLGDWQADRDAMQEEMQTYRKTNEELGLALQKVQEALYKEAQYKVTDMRDVVTKNWLLDFDSWNGTYEYWIDEAKAAEDLFKLVGKNPEEEVAKLVAEDRESYKDFYAKHGEYDPFEDEWVKL